MTENKKAKYVKPAMVSYAIMTEGTLLSTSGGDPSIKIDSDKDYGDGEVEQRSMQRAAWDEE